jgi:hypothetical protein
MTIADDDYCWRLLLAIIADDCWIMVGGQVEEKELLFDSPSVAERYRDVG